VSEEILRKGKSGPEFRGDAMPASLKPFRELLDDDQPQHSVKNSNARPSGIPGVGDIEWGEHLCVLYRGEHELLKLVASFIQAGLQNNEFCTWITGEPVTERDALEALEALLPQTQDYLIQKRLEILPYHQWFLPSGVFNGEMVLENWISKARYNEANGFAGTRITGNPFWLHSEEEWTQFGCYEQQIEAAIRSERVLTLCTYPIERCSHEHMLQILSNHGSTILKTNSEWQRTEIQPRH
jgi:hypothetical protein